MNQQYTFTLDGKVLPIIIQTIERTSSSNNKVITTLDGPINKIGSPRLTEIQIKGMLCWNWKPSYMKNVSVKEPTYYIDLLNHHRENKLPMSINIFNQSGERSVALIGIQYIVIEDFTCEESAKNGSDFDINLTLKEYIAWGNTKFVQVDGAIEVIQERPDYVTEPERLLFEQMQRRKRALEAYELRNGSMLVVIGDVPRYLALREKYMWKHAIVKENGSFYCGGEK